MVRKIRQVVTFEIYNIAERMLNEGGNTIKGVAETLNLSIRTVKNISKNVFEGDIFKPASEKFQKTVEKRAVIPRSEEQIMRNIIACKNDVTLNEIKSELLEKHGVNISLPTISRKLKKLNISRKRLSLIPDERNSERKIDIRAIYAADVSVYQSKNLIFLDESGFNLHQARAYGYSPVNQKAYKVVRANRGQSISCMCVIGYDGVIAKEVKKGAYNGESFINFVQKFLVNYFNSNPEKILIMDNVRFHHSRIVLEFLRTMRIPFMFLPPYSPQLNPIEEFFSILKSRFNAFRDTYVTVEETLEHVFQENFSSQCVGFYRHMDTWIEKARQKEEFI